MERAVEAVKNAEDVRLLINGFFAYPASNMQYSSAMDLVTAMGIWEISQTTRVRDGVKVKEFRVCLQLRCMGTPPCYFLFLQREIIFVIFCLP